MKKQPGRQRTYRRCSCDWKCTAGVKRQRGCIRSRLGANRKLVSSWQSSLGLSAAFCNIGRPRGREGSFVSRLEWRLSTTIWRSSTLLAVNVSQRLSHLAGRTPICGSEKELKTRKECLGYRWPAKAVQGAIGKQKYTCRKKYTGRGPFTAALPYRFGHTYPRQLLSYPSAFNPNHNAATQFSLPLAHEPQNFGIFNRSERAYDSKAVTAGHCARSIWRRLHTCTRCRCALCMRHQCWILTCMHTHCKRLLAHIMHVHVHHVIHCSSSGR